MDQPGGGAKIYGDRLDAFPHRAPYAAIHGSRSINRPPFRPGPAPFAKREAPRDAAVNKDAHRVNHQIRIPQVRLIDADGENRGVVSTRDALAMAEEAGLDLVEISPGASPPVCKILDYGKFKYEEQKKAAEARKKQKVIDIKEIKLRPTIDTNDYEVKMKAARRFLGDGDKVKVTLRFRGREMAHMQLGAQLLDRVKADLAEISKVEQSPKLEGRQMIMVIAPK